MPPTSPGWPERATAEARRITDAELCLSRANRSVGCGSPLGSRDVAEGRQPDPAAAGRASAHK